MVMTPAKGQGAPGTPGRASPARASALRTAAGREAAVLRRMQIAGFPEVGQKRV